MSFWQQCEGVVLDGRYRLERCFAAGQDQALFQTGDGAVVRVKISDWRTDEDLLARWTLAARLSHPNLLRVWAADSCELKGARVIYVVMERADDDLAGVLKDRALDAAEARDVLESVLDALRYLHGQGLVHGRIKPSNIMAAGETIKLSSDALGRDGEERRAPLPPTSYDAPESASTAPSPAADVWSLGMILREALTRRAPETAPDLREIDPPFREVVEHCVRPFGEQRWRVAQIANYLEAVSREPVPVPPPAAPQPLPPAAHPAPARLARPAKWLYAAAALLAVLLGFTLWRRPDPAIQAQSPLPATPAASPAPASPVPRAANLPRQTGTSAALPARDGSPVWRVIAYTYRSPAGAQSKVRQINGRWPGFKAEVFSVKSNRPPYLVAVGGRMSRDEALRLRQRVRKAGLPRDSYVQNYSH